jgi:hypothetical protein
VEGERLALELAVRRFSIEKLDFLAVGGVGPDSGWLALEEADEERGHAVSERKGECILHFYKNGFEVL